MRTSARSRALSLGLTGWIRNRPDGAVEAVCEGDDASVETFRRWCYTGSETANVQSVTPIEEPFQGEFQDFSIL